MTDFICEPPLTIPEDCSVHEALDAMFRSGVRAFLVVRELTVVGLITAEDIRGAADQSVAQRMTPAAQMPAIDWQTMQESRVEDLRDIFEGAGIEHLVVLESDGAKKARVRGVVHRGRLERRLRPRADTLYV
jgi:CBS domain-containing protein